MPGHRGNVDCDGSDTLILPYVILQGLAKRQQIADIAHLDAIEKTLTARKSPTTHEPPPWARLPASIDDIERQRRAEPVPRIKRDLWFQRPPRQRQLMLFRDALMRRGNRERK